LCRVLIIDDNADLTEAMATVLTICGFQTATAYNGRLALEKARAFRPEIILLDINLPDMDGYQVASTIRRDCGWLSTLFIAMSAGEPDCRAPHAEEARFDRYLIKPVDLDVLLRILSGLGARGDPT
jgi:two-component system CheB/CheR fusion protein